MPFGPYDLHGEVYDRFCEEQIAIIVLFESSGLKMPEHDVGQVGTMPDSASFSSV